MSVDQNLLSMNDAGERRQAIWMRDPSELRLHPLLKRLPAPDKESAEWHAFVDAVSGAGPEGMAPLYATLDGQVLAGGRRLAAARQIGFREVPCMVREESEAATIIVEDLISQRSLSKGAKVYLCLGLLEEFVKAAEIRRLNNLKRGRKTLEKCLKLPKGTQCPSEKGWAEIGERLGASERLVKQAAAVHRLFAIEAKFEFQDGSEATLKEHFEPALLDSESPMGLGEVIKGCGWFVDENGKPKKQAPPGDRNSHLHYFESAWGNCTKQFRRWDKLKPAERERALEIVVDGIREWPSDVLEGVADAARAKLREERQ